MFFFLRMFLFMSFVVDPNNDGGSGEDEYLFKDLDEETPPPAKEAADKNPPPIKEPDNKSSPEPDDKTKELEKRLKEIEERETIARQKEQLSELTETLRTKYQGFDINKVINHLKEIDKKSPGAGNALFTNEGIELVWKSEFANKADAEFDDSRGSGISKDDSELIEKIKNDTATQEEQYRLFSRFA
jgi:outer membrane biosynthesis protein TonB